MVEHQLALLRGRLLGLSVEHELEPDEETLGVDPAEDRMLLLQLLQLLVEIDAGLRCALDDLLPLVHVERRVRGGGGERRGGEGRDVRSRAPAREDLLRRDEGRDRLFPRRGPVLPRSILVRSQASLPLSNEAKRRSPSAVDSARRRT